MENNLQIIVNESGLEKTKADYILENFQSYFSIAAEWERRAKDIVVTADDQKTIMEMARAGRLLLRDKRIQLEKARKTLKEQALREGKAIDGIANVLKGLIEPIEDYLDKQENFTKYRLAAEAEKMRIEAEKKAEEERIAKEKADAEERERIKLENEKLKAEAIEREKKAYEEMKKAEEEKKALQAKADAERKAAEEKAAAAAKKAAEEKAKLQAELSAKADAERKAVKTAEMLKNKIAERKIKCPHCQKEFVLN